ncbi:MAG: MoaD/ThiS family protein [Pirellulaceae bacterium]|jgi:molybdopterin synthase sulfur carrier subunit|nr:molybdopterin synthase sulfur carrier subunit [Planctomycetaceae bacterium]HIN94430.1 molybdopterin synthase sulfur carrier subunit [Planctomycetota bacterium]
MALVFIPTQLRQLTNGVEQLELDVRNVRQVIEQLESRFPGIKERLCEGDELSPSIQVCVGQTLSSRGMITKVAADSEVHFLPAIGGG